MRLSELEAARRLLSQTPEGANALKLIDQSWEEECRGPGLYPETLFHFTDKEGLFGILATNFRVTFSLERIACRPIGGEIGSTEPAGLFINRVFGAPMVSFCDLRLSELRVHMRDYGQYGIGM